MRFLASSLGCTAEQAKLFGLETLLALGATATALALLSGAWPPFIIAAAMLLLLSMLRPNLLLLAVIFLLPIAPVLSVNAPLRDIATGLRITVFLGFAMGSLMRGQSVKSLLFSSSLDYLIIGYFSLTALSVLLSPASHSSARALLRLFSYVCTYFLITAWIHSRNFLGHNIRVLLYSTLFVELFAIYQSVIGGYSKLFDLFYPVDMRVDWEGRVTSFLNYSNSLAGYLNLVLPLALIASLLPTKELPRYLSVTALIGGVIALFLTQSRGGLVAFSLVVLFSIYSVVKSRRMMALLFATTILLISAALPLMARFSSHFEEVESRTTISRFALWGAAAQMFAASPIIGVGYGNFRDLYAPIIDIDWIEEGSYDAHNIYLQTLAETGVAGFAVFAILITTIIRFGIEQFRKGICRLDCLIGFAAVGAVLSVLVHGFVDYLFQVSPQFGSLFWVIVALLVVSRRLNSVSEGTEVSA